MTAGSVFSHCGPIRKFPKVLRPGYMPIPGSKGAYPGVETPFTPDGPDVLDGDGVDGIWAMWLGDGLLDVTGWVVTLGKDSCLNSLVNYNFGAPRGASSLAVERTAAEAQTQCTAYRVLSLWR
jgi:hypothetical protein